MALAIAVAAISVLPSTASAASWRVIGEHDQENFATSAAVRGPDGTLHVVYADDVVSGDNGLRYRTISTAGVISAPSTVIANWVNVTNPDIELVAGVPTVYWGGQGSTDVSNPTSSGQAWSATLTAGVWSAPTAFTTNGTAYASTSFSTAIDNAGAPWGTWTSTSILYTHAGATAAGTETNLGTDCCDYATNLGRDQVTGALMLNFYSNATGRVGYWTRQVAPTLGAATRLVGGVTSSGDALSANTRLAAAERTTGGVYSAFCDTYPICTGIRVAAGTSAGLRYRLTESMVPTIADGIWTAPAPDGRMWLMWSNRSRTYIARSNKALTKWGTLQAIANPPRTDTNWRVTGEGSRGPLDLFANASTTAGAGTQTREWMIRVLPALTLTPSSARLINNRARVVTFRLTDAGDRVMGAQVRFRGVVRTTNALGYVRFGIPAGTRVGRYYATGYATGYNGAIGTVLLLAPRR